MNRFKRMILLLGSSLSTIFLLGSCSTLHQAVGKATLSISPLPVVVTRTLSPTTTPTPIFTPTKTSAEINTFTETDTPTATQTETPLPTLSAEKAEEFFVELFKTNRGCLLPCWWGFTPGETSWEDARRFLEPFARFNKLVDQTKPRFSMDFLVPVPKETFHIPLEHIYRVQDGIITSMVIQLGSIPEYTFSSYTLSSFLTTYGPPREIWLSTYSTEYPPGVLPVMIILFYPDRGILATYFPWRAAIVGNTIQACEVDAPPSMFGLWSPDRKMTFMEAAREFRLNLDEEGILVLPIEEATKMDVKTFYETYQNPNTTICLETPKELWPEQF